MTDIQKLLETATVAEVGRLKMENATLRTRLEAAEAVCEAAQAFSKRQHAWERNQVPEDSITLQEEYERGLFSLEKALETWRQLRR